MEPPPSPLASYLVHSDSTADDNPDTADDHVHSDASTAELVSDIAADSSVTGDGTGRGFRGANARDLSVVTKMLLFCINVCI